MNIRKFTAIVVCSLLIGLVTVSRTTAQVGANPATLQDLAQNCRLAQDYLKKNQRSRDLRTRVDRLQAYRYIYQRFDNFVERLERNNQPNAAELRARLETFAKTTEDFKQTYEHYDTAREAVAGLPNCNRSVSEFTKRLEAMRAKRQQLNMAVTAGDSLLSDGLKSQLDSLYQQLLIGGSSGSLQ